MALVMQAQQQRCGEVSSSMYMWEQRTLVSILSLWWRTRGTISAVLTSPDRNPMLPSTNLHPLITQQLLVDPLHYPRGPRNRKTVTNPYNGKI